MKMRGKFDNLLKPGKIGALELKNRIVMPAMGSLLAGESGEVSDALIEWYAKRAKGGAGLIIVEICLAATAIDPLRINDRPLRADNSMYISGLARLAGVIHENGAKAGIELSAGGGASARGEPWIPDGQSAQKTKPVSPSGVPAFGRTDHPRMLSVEEIEEIVQLCGNAAQNVKQAGFDMIEIHAHAGYLISEFLSPYYNRRTDKYCGSLDNRCQFLLEIVDSMKKAVGHDFPITVKYSIEDFLPDGWDTNQSQYLAKRLEAAGVNGIGISAGAPETKMSYLPPYFYPRGCHLPFAEAIKKVVNIQVFVGGRLNDPRLADKALKDDKADFIYEGRALIADPDWPKKVASGKIEEIRRCLSCNECRQQLINRQPVRCAVNAVAGIEGELGLVKPAGVKRKVLVVGGGPAGMEAARIAALRGHKVVLCERYRHLGGLMLLGGVHNEEITVFAKWIVAQIKKLPVDVRLQTEVTPELVAEVKPDVVILANGGKFVKLEVPGIDRVNVFSAQDLLYLMNGIPVKKGIILSSFARLARPAITATTVRYFLGSNFLIKRNVAIIGAQFAGCSLAIALAHKRKKVTMIEESDSFGNDMEVHAMVRLKAEIEAGNVEVLTSTKVHEITDKGVVTIDGAGNKILHKASTVIVALELVPSDGKLARELEGKVEEVYTIGDAKSFRRIIKAISEGYVTAYNL